MNKTAVLNTRLLGLFFVCSAFWANAQAQTVVNDNGTVVVHGIVPDEDARQELLGKIKLVYGVENVVDQLGIGPNAAPPNWTKNVSKLLTEDLTQIHEGKLTITGNTVELTGVVENEQIRQEILSRIAQNLNPTYTIRNGLRAKELPTKNEQEKQIKQVMENKIIEFETSSAVLTPVGLAVLESLLPILKENTQSRYQIVGHTDATGDRTKNIVLSKSRAESVRKYLVQNGIASARLETMGAGPDMPIAPNDTPENRARNRRIELKVIVPNPSQTEATNADAGQASGS